MRTRTPRRAALGAAALLAALALVTGCTGGNGGGDGGTSPTGSHAADDVRGTLRVLASSELSDMKPVLDAVREDSGIEVEPTYSGTVDAVDQVASGRADGKYDAVWLSSDDYLRLHEGATDKVVSETAIMSSPVAIGVRPAAVKRLGWDASHVTWAQVHDAVAQGELTYGMTDPARSNSGFSALVAVAAALSGAQSALSDADVRTATPKLKEFFRGQQLTSGSSGWLATAYKHRGDVDALVNYESVLLSMNRDDHTGLTVIRPSDGVVTATYPLSALSSADDHAKDLVAALTDRLRSPEAQGTITDRTLRRPVVSSVDPAPGIDGGKRRELPFPGSKSVADGLVDAYENKLRRPSRTVYVLDTSGSMAGDRLKQLKGALTGLTGDFREREEVTLMPFGSSVKQVRTHVVDPGSPDEGLAAIRSDTEALTASGDTAVYSSLEEAYDHLGSGSADAFTSIVLMTDGENTTGPGAGTFDGFYAKLPGSGRGTPVFPIVFGDSDRGALQHIADLTGGRLFDARKDSLDNAFEEIRGYQ
ncbi:substrate-binding domain-containing protein [Streptomyces sp. NPDC050560]|uniref:substrate-binding and vWA domain-containing protein n=1 Tax=Streptomyces sp. NPDC050560 TaxID=3365630 RepID=UPI0037A4332C